MVPTKKDLILLRGLPGSGKSTLAALLSRGGGHPVFSIDSYFTNPETGEYLFEHDKKFFAYRQCEKQSAEAMQQGLVPIFVHNTLTIDWKIEPYFKLS